MLLKLVSSAVLKDLLAICIYWLWMCFSEKIGDHVNSSIWIVFFVVVAGIFYFVLFFIHSPLFIGWIKNDYAWSLTTGFFTFLVFIPVVMWSIHHPCPLSWF